MMVNVLPVVILKSGPEAQAKQLAGSRKMCGMRGQVGGNLPTHGPTEGSFLLTFELLLYLIKAVSSPLPVNKASSADICAGGGVEAGLGLSECGVRLRRILAMRNPRGEIVKNNMVNFRR
jgi:hypothetical protein